MSKKEILPQKRSFYGVKTINHHIKSIYRDRELLPEATIRKYRIVQNEGKRHVTRMVDYYNLEIIIAVGYRVRSHRGVQFRQWATARLKEFIVKGFVLDDERLAEPGGIDYFDELLERIRAIRFAPALLDCSIQSKRIEIGNCLFAN